MSILNEIKSSIIEGRQKETESYISAALSEGILPKQILDEAMMPAMDHVGKLMMDESDPHIFKAMSASRCMQAGLDMIASSISTKTEGPAENQQKKVTILLGTIEGDLHDIGKNLACTYLKSCGFEVIDLGINNSGKNFAKAASENPDIDVVCISSQISVSIQNIRSIVSAIRTKTKNRNCFIILAGGGLDKTMVPESGADAYSDSIYTTASLAGNTQFRKGGNGI